MNSTSLFFRFLPLSAVLVLAACGGEGAQSAGAETAGADTTIKPVVREPLTETDMMGLEMSDLAMELPWTGNRVARDPAPGQGQGWLEAVETAEGEGFARVQFTFTDIAFYPGYEAQIVEAGTNIPCGEEGKPLSLSGDRALVIRLRPANAHNTEGVRVPVRTRPLAPEAFTEGGLVCDLNDNVVWAAGLSSGDQVRVLEFRNPKRLVVDIR